jgi:hypothetical protein
MAKFGLECYDEGTTGFNHAMRVQHCSVKTTVHGLEKHALAHIAKMKTETVIEKELKKAAGKTVKRELAIAKAKLEYFDSL